VFITAKEIRTFKYTQYTIFKDVFGSKTR